MEELKYDALSAEIKEKIENDRKTGNAPKLGYRDDDAIRRTETERDLQTIWRSAFVRDIEKIMHCPFYNRYADKTQVFSFYKNDDITRRALHVQLVSRIARNIGKVLNLNLDLIEAIALGHDMGHTPFGHAGERFLNELYNEQTGRYFNHNVHSVRVLDSIFCRNVSLQTLDGILCHNGEFVQKEYRPHKTADFSLFDKKVEECYKNQEFIGTLVPSTLEGCVVRICDMIAYMGKDRQDARRAKIFGDELIFSKGKMGIENADIINNLVVNIIENSYGKDYILLDFEYYEALKTAKRENMEYIYKNEHACRDYEENIKPMFHAVYHKLLADLRERRKSSVIYSHHIDYINKAREYYTCPIPYEDEEENQIVVDYIASMTDDYFVDLYHYLFPDGKYQVCYHSYFEDIQS